MHVCVFILMYTNMLCLYAYLYECITMLCRYAC